MADKIPVKSIYNGGNPEALGDFEPGDSVPVNQGGTGAVTPSQGLSNLGGITKPVSTMDDALTRFNGSQGQVQNSGVTLDDANNILGVNRQFQENGSNTIPSYSFANSTGTGLFKGLNDNLGVAVATTHVLAFVQTHIEPKVKIAQIDGTATYPSYTFIGEQGTGMFRGTSGELAFSVAGSKVMRMDTDGTLSVTTTDYETLVLANNDIPNRKYVRDLHLSHADLTDNPHNVTKAQVGLGNVPNLDTTSAVNDSHTHANKSQLDLVTDGDHDVRTDNPHNITTTQIGAIPTAEKGSANGVAELDSGSRIPIAQIPNRAIPDFKVVANATARLALIVQEGDESKQIDDGSHWIYDGTTWHLISVPPVVTLATIGGNIHPVYVDSTKGGKTLTVATHVFSWFEANLTNNDWCQLGTASDTDSGHAMHYNGTIVGVALHCENDNNVTKNIRLYIDDTQVNTNIIETTGTGNATKVETGTNIDFNAGQKLRLRAGGGGTINDIVMDLLIKWRV